MIAYLATAIITQTGCYTPGTLPGSGAPGLTDLALLMKRARSARSRRNDGDVVEYPRGYGFIRVCSVIQFTSQVFPPSGEYDCSKCGALLVVAVH